MEFEDFETELDEEEIVIKQPNNVWKADRKKASLKMRKQTAVAQTAKLKNAKKQGKRLEPVQQNGKTIYVKRQHDSHLQAELKRKTNRALRRMPLDEVPVKGLSFQKQYSTN